MTEEELRATANFFMDPSVIAIFECSVDGVALDLTAASGSNNAIPKRSVTGGSDPRLL